MKKPFVILWVLGALLICAFRTPVKYYQFYDSYIVLHTHIFSSKGKILAGQFILYLAIWSAFVFGVDWLFKYMRKHK